MHAQASPRGDDWKVKEILAGSVRAPVPLGKIDDIPEFLACEDKDTARFEVCQCLKCARSALPAPSLEALSRPYLCALTPAACAREQLPFLQVEKPALFR